MELGLFLSQTETVQSRVVIDSKDLAIVDREPAEMNPALHGVATLVQQLTSLGVQRIEHARVGTGRPLCGREQILFPLLGALEMQNAEHFVLERILSRRQGKQHAIGDDWGIGQIEVRRNPCWFEVWGTCGFFKQNSERHYAAVGRRAIRQRELGSAFRCSTPDRDIYPSV